MRRLIRETIEQRVYGMNRPGHEGRLQWLEKNATTGSDFFNSPVVLPILMGESNSYDGFGWTSVVADSTVRNGAVRTNGNGRTPSLNDFLTIGCTLGPQGSIWGLLFTYKTGSDCGQITFSLASVASPNPNRAGANDAGTLTDGALSYVTMSTVDTYFASAQDASQNGYVVPTFRINGAAGATLSAFSGHDAYTGFFLIDGGPGFYKLKLKVTGKNASSTGYRAQITGLAWVRLDDEGFL